MTYSRYSCQVIDEEDIQSVVRVLGSDFLTQGPTVVEFEKSLAKYCGAAHAVAVASGTAALHAACASLGIGPGDTVWTSPISFVASANCARYVGAMVDFIDVNPDDGNIDIEAFRKKLADAQQKHALPRLDIPVHFSGRTVDMQEVWKLSQQYGFLVLEDAAHALGAVYADGARVGCCQYSHGTILSFHPVKTITTAEGGMIVTNDEGLAERLRIFTSHGITRAKHLLENQDCEEYYYEQQQLGYHYRMNELQAALGVTQAKRIDEFVERRRMLAERYRTLLAGNSMRLPPADAKSAWHLYVVGICDVTSAHNRDVVFRRLKEKGIGVNVHYIPIYRQPYYRKLGFSAEDFPGAERFYSGALSIPLHPVLSDIDQDYIVHELLATI